ncbi:unnamed protein product [Alternaria alternata]
MSSQFNNWRSDPSESHGPLMSITCWSLGGVSLLFLVVRCGIRQSQKKFWYDDGLLVISWFLLLVQLILNQLSINLGFGKHALDIDFSHFERITYYGASGLTVSIAAIILSKISFGVTLLRLTEGWLKAYVWFAIITLFAFAVPLVLWAAIMDISLALLPWKVLWNLKMRTAEKIGVGIAMSLGLLAGATAIVRARYVELLQTQDLSYEAYNSVIWSTAESAMTIVATSIPILRVFFKQAVSQAMSNYHNSTSRSKSKSTASGSNPSQPSNNASTLANDTRRLSKKITRITGHTSTDSLFRDDDIENQDRKEGYIRVG